MVLCQTLALSSPVMKVLAYGGALLLLLLVAFPIIKVTLARRNRELDKPTTGFNIESLEGLLKNGLLTEEEFDKLRRRALRIDAQAKEKAALSPPAKDVDGKDGSGNATQSQE